ncbi:MAG: hypothetical protein HZB43_04610 [candidate division Zixibacteria bacterium]|nr:hypothetical protein [candidate division Zixibacteria bacterium]
MKMIVRFVVVIAFAVAWPAIVHAVDIGPRRMTLPNENLAKESYLTVPAGNWVFAMSYEYEMLKNVFTGSKETTNSSNSFTLNNTLALDVTYGLSDNITLNAIIPYKYVFNTRRVDSALVSGSEGIFFTDRRGSQGLGDIVIMSYLRIHFGRLIRFGDEYYPSGDDGYDDYIASGPNEYAGRHQGPIFALALGARIPTGKTDIADSRNQRLPDNLQLGTGTMDPIGGILYHQRYYRLGWGLSGLYRLSSKENIYHYQWGNEIVGSAYLSYRLNRSLEFVNQFNGNWMDTDTYNYVRVPNAGGTVVFYTPSLIYVGAKNMTLQASAEIPIYRDFASSQLMSDYIINVRTSFNIR